MKYNVVTWHVMSRRMKLGLKECWKEESVSILLKRAKRIYKELLSRVEGISDANPMASNISKGFIVVAVWLASERKITPDQMIKIVERACDWNLQKGILGMIDLNTEKGIRTFGNMMKRSAAWAEAHPEDTNTWDFHFDETLHKDGFYYHFTHCPIADFCKKYGYEEIIPVLCYSDYITMGMMHSVLHREHTIAEGGGICDYWIVGDQIANPQ